MGWVIGGWRILREGEVHQALKKCINFLLEENFSLQADLTTETKEIQHGREFYEVLRDFERSHGVNDLIELLSNGLRIKASKNGDTVVTDVVLRTPSDSEERCGLFKDTISAWVEENPLTYSERFFRLPKISEDIADRYLDNPLEQTLKKTHGFHFQYKIVSRYEGDSENFTDLRKNLYRALR